MMTFPRTEPPLSPSMEVRGSPAGPTGALGARRTWLTRSSLRTGGPWGSSGASRTGGSLSPCEALRARGSLSARHERNGYRQAPGIRFRVRALILTELGIQCSRPARSEGGWSHHS